MRNIANFQYNFSNANAAGAYRDWLRDFGADVDCCVYYSVVHS